MGELTELISIGVGAIIVLFFLAIAISLIGFVAGILLEILSFAFKVICFPFALIAVTLALLKD
tara:strand:+ start:1810 stop:1998 length:189 start_codon:yes stop_codon:yes gene_type:complete